MTVNNKIDSLEFLDIKNNIIDFYKLNPVYKDYNFDGSNLSSLLNLLSLNTHYVGFYVKMLMNESFSDSAQTLESLISHAKESGYVVKGKRAARALVSFKVNGVDSSVNTIKIPKGTILKASGDSTLNTTFVTLDDNIIKRNTNDEFISGDIIVYEGGIEKVSYNVRLNSTFIIDDIGCDIDNISVFVKPTALSNIRSVYNFAENLIDITSDSKVFYVVTTAKNKYEIVFGNNIFGDQPEINSVVEINYLKCNGTKGNSVKNFVPVLSKTSSTKPTDINYYSGVVLTTVEASSGGLDTEDLEAIRFGIPTHNRLQKRAVNEQDYKSIIISYFRNIDSISVWGGEKNSIRDYGKLYISIKPKFSDKITMTAKKEITNNIVKKFSIVGENIVFVDPDFTDISMTVYAKIDRSRAVDDDGYIETTLTERAFEYNDSTLSKFESSYSETGFLDYCKDGLDYITSIYTTKFVTKKLEFIRGTGTGYTVDFSNAVTTMKSTEFQYGLSVCYLYAESNGNIYIYDKTNSKKLENVFGTMNFDTGLMLISIPKDVTDNFINITCTPQYPDVETKLNNIVRIKTVEVILK